MLSTLDIISNGRIELGIGAGWHEEEYRQYGYDFPATVVRIAQLDEAVSIIKAMWSKQNAGWLWPWLSSSATLFLRHWICLSSFVLNLSIFSFANHMTFQFSCSEYTTTLSFCPSTILGEGKFYSFRTSTRED
jgi:alkanesulfonate monooxygenase SsuD/methylene tetrahydromethanopterin reductase-like flavin-dependent oxidoreductase (luciferase family)